MGLYIYRNPNTEETVEVFQKMNDKHVYFDESGLEWKRVYTLPTSSVDSQVPLTKNDFMEVTSKKRGTYGDMMDLSREMSEKRKQIRGEDPVRRKYFDEYSKKRHGKKHQLDRPKSIEKNGVKIEF